MAAMGTTSWVASTPPVGAKRFLTMSIGAEHDWDEPRAEWGLRPLDWPMKPGIFDDFGKRHRVEGFELKRFNEAFRFGVVVGVSLPSH